LASSSAGKECAPIADGFRLNPSRQRDATLLANHLTDDARLDVILAVAEGFALPEEQIDAQLEPAKRMLWRLAIEHFPQWSNTRVGKAVGALLFKIAIGLRDHPEDMLS
jgi:hypothetical protein